MKYFTHNFQTKILLTLFLGLITILSFGEGTKQTAPSSSDEVSLCVNNSGYGYFARYNSTDAQRLYIRIQNPNSEKVYLGFSRGKSTPTGSEITSYFRIKDPNGNVVYGPQILDNTTSNITGNNTQKWTKAKNGPNGIDGTTNGYNAFVFNPTGLPAGDYWIEFERSGWGTEIHYNYYDITVASGTTSKQGRVWSKRWALSLPDANENFNGAFYVFAPDYGSTTGDVTQNGFVNKIDFNGAGFRPWYFNVSFNSTGTGNTGNTAQDRKSVWNALSTEPEYEVFLTNPDINIWQNGSYDDRIIINEMTRCGVDESCINVDVYATGDVEVLLDFYPAGAPDGVYTAGTTDRIIVQNIDPEPGELPPFSVCVPWDGLDGLGNLVDVNANVPVVVTFAQAAFHFPVYDVEENQFGFSASPVRPAPPVGYVLKFYWDDSNINWNSNTGSPKVNLTGCAPSTTPPGGCHTWDGFNGSNGTPQYGNNNTINTWWYANRDQASANLNMPDYIYAVGPTNPIYASPSNPIQVDGSFWWKNDGQYGDEVLWSTSGDGTFSENPSPSCTYNPGPNDLALGYVDITFTPDPDENCVTPSYTFRIIFCTLDASVITEDVSCFGASDGSIAVTASNGTPPYQYSINGGTYGSSNIFSDLSSGTYYVTVKDANDCIVTIIDIVITEAENTLEATITDQTNVSCNGLADGTATVEAGGGTPDYSYSWNTTPVQTGVTATGLAAGSYTVTVTDANGCTETASVTITQPTDLTATITDQTNVSCNGLADGTATVEAGGGTPDYSYSWNTTPVQTGVTATGLAAGSYTVTVTDANGCTETASVTITQPTDLTATITDQTNVSCNGLADGTATVEAGGGTPDYSYSWNTTPVQTGVTATGLAAGSYTVTVTDANGCTETASVTITQPTDLTATITDQTNVSCNGLADGTATVEAGGGTPDYSYSWNTTPVQTGVTATGLAAGSYTVTVTDANGCTETASVTITQPTDLTATITDQTNVSCNGLADGTATVEAGGGTPDYSYSWNTTPVQTGVTATGLAAGSYTVTVTDANGCTETASVTITQPTDLTADHYRSNQCFL